MDLRKRDMRNLVNSYPLILWSSESCIVIAPFLMYSTHTHCLEHGGANLVISQHLWVFLRSLVSIAAELLYPSFLGLENKILSNQSPYI